jgi:hypothetical protein
VERRRNNFLNEDMIRSKPGGHRWKYRWSGEVAAVTIITVLVLAWSILFIFQSHAPVAVKLIIGIIPAATLVWTGALVPLSLTVNGEGVVLRRAAGRLTIPADEILEIRTVGREELRKGLVRTAGVGGLFGYIGRFRNPGLGNLVLNITEWRNLVMVRTAKKNYIFNGRSGDSGISG